jgi:UDP-N-acetylglucosamine--N-acetylmuramyl-(pentapeptide) pyrophosphoryl-undecaprenol N-acetylglucosamine transferase
MTPQRAPKIAIACGGTGGHLFPGIAVAGQLVRRGCRVTLLISPKEVDQQAVKNVSGMEIVTLPAVGLTRGRVLAFASGFLKSYRTAKKVFRQDPPQAALAMGGFTSAPPILAAKHLGAKTFLHESNTIPGRANRWLSRVVNQAFVGFTQAAARLHARNVIATGTPVRPQFLLDSRRQTTDARNALGFDSTRPLLLISGGSQGATGINNLLIDSLPLLPSDLQFLHFTGANDVERVRRAYVERNLRAVVHDFFSEMDLALCAATAVISRAGASSLAEIAAMRVPAILIPFPAATDNHQFFNARAFEEAGAARLLEQNSATPEMLAKLVGELTTDQTAYRKMQSALGRLDAPNAAQEIAEKVLCALGQSVKTSFAAETGKRDPHSVASDRQSFSAA